MAKKPTKPAKPAAAKVSTVDLMSQRLKEVGQEKDRQEKELQKLQERLRKDTYNDSLRAEVQSAKTEIGKVCDEYAELARAVSSLSGGKNHFPPPTT
jgi:glucan phosphorylase